MWEEMELRGEGRAAVRARAGKKGARRGAARRAARLPTGLLGLGQADICDPLSCLLAKYRRSGHATVHAQLFNGQQTGSLLQLVAIAAVTPSLNRGEYKKVRKSNLVADLAI